MKNSLFVLLMGISAYAAADNSTLDAAIGGGLGGAAGAAIGNEIGGRDGAILGGALGAAAGTAITTEKGRDHGKHVPRATSYRGQVMHKSHPVGHPGYHCPPGQAKKGRC